MIRAPDDATPSRAGAGRSRRAWVWACVLLVALTWVPVLALHVRNMSIADPGAGMLIAVFPWTSSTRDVFRSIGEAKGAPVSPIAWIPRAWVVRSGETGFAGRLRERGALGVYSPNLLSVRQVLSCSGMATPPPSAGSAS